MLQVSVDFVEQVTYALTRSSEALERALKREAMLKAEAERNKLLSLSEAKDYLKVCDETLMHYRVLGLVHYKKGKGVWFRKGDIDDWLAEGMISRRKRK